MSLTSIPRLTAIIIKLKGKDPLVIRPGIKKRYPMLCILEKPTFITQPEDAAVFVSDPISLFCEATGVPAPTLYQW